MAAAKGNRYAAHGKRWEEALKRALARIGTTTDLGLAPIADKVVRMAAAGDMDAIREVACRLDGKPTEHVRIEQDVNINVGNADSIGRKLDKALERREVNTIQ